MAKFKGKELMIQALTAPATYTDIAGMTSTSFTINQESVDVTDKDGNLWRELLEGAGVTSMDVSCSGQVNDAAAYAFLIDAVINKTHVTLKIIRGLGDEFEGLFEITSTSANGDYNAAETYDFAFASAGEIEYTAAP